ncbi:MAG: hypothetical protein E7441_11575 [Ruminococcaceae bacterium]|nr:hypothetical protein [Oscillospiraceae bacterium]
MKKMSKTLLSMALAIAMVFSLMPMSFAVESETASEKSGVYVEYDIMSHSGDIGTFGEILTYAKTNGFFACTAVTNSKWVTWHTTKCIKIDGAGTGITLKINVPVKGRYDIKIRNYISKNGKDLKAYIYPENVTPNDDELSSGGKYYIGSVDCSNQTSGNIDASNLENEPNQFMKENTPVSYTFPTAGEYYILFKMDEGTGFVGNIILDGGTGYALIGDDMTISPESVETGKTAQVTAPATAYRSDNGEAVTLTYACTDAGVTVNPSTGEISIASDCEPGKKTITATAEGAVNSISRELEVTAAKSGITVQYDIMSHKYTIEYANELTYAATNGFFTYAAANASGLAYHPTSTCIQLSTNQWIIFKINVPVAGKYDVKIKNHLGNTGENLYAYIFPDTVTPNADALSDDNYIGYVDCSKSDPNANNGADTGIPNAFLKDGVNASYTFPTAGEYYIGFTVTATGKKGFVGNIVLDGGSNDVLMSCFSGETTLRTGETATLSGYLSSTATAADVTYESSNDCVTVGTDGTITAVAPGKATVTMTANDSTVLAGSPYTVDITVPDADLQTAFDAEPVEEEGYIAPSVTGITGDGIIEANKNTDGSYNLTAPDDDSENKFLYWAMGMGTNKRIVSFDAILRNYVPEGNGVNYLVPVYENDVDTTVAEYYNRNGQRIATGEVGGEKPALPSMAGYGAAKEWINVTGTNFWYAEYEKATPDDVTVTVDEEEDTVAYGTLITCTADSAKDNFKCWTKKGANETEAEIVSVDKTYTFYAWEDCTVTAVYEQNYPLATAMKIIIDCFEVNSETGIMAEFVGITNAVEKGILFTDTEGTERKIAMTTTDNQFTIVPDESGTYVGYAILKDGNAYSRITDGSYTKQAE